MKNAYKILDAIETQIRDLDVSHVMKLRHEVIELYGVNILTDVYDGTFDELEDILYHRTLGIVRDTTRLLTSLDK